MKAYNVWWHNEYKSILDGHWSIYGKYGRSKYGDLKRLTLDEANLILNEAKYNEPGSSYDIFEIGGNDQPIIPKCRISK